MRFSVIINTYNRARALRQTLLSLRHQTYTNFEVIVVNGPSTDGTEVILAEFGDQIRALSCPKPRLSMSRNIGLSAAAGDIVAYIDDDAIPTPRWLEELARAYEEPNVGAVGGLVYDQTGVQLQYRYAACNRDGIPNFNIEPPLDQYTKPMADPVAYLQGTNMSYSRAVLQKIGGFDQNILHYYDDVETCMQVIDHGYKLRALNGAAVHHKFLASHIRDHKRITLDPFNQLSDRIYFALQHGRGTRTVREMIDRLMVEADAQRHEADANVVRGSMTTTQRDYLHSRVEQAIEVGLAKGLSGTRGSQVIPAPRAEDFVKFPVLTPQNSRLKLCFISREYPPGDFGGPGRYSHEMAAGFARFGHEVHVITRSPDIHRLDFEDGVWVHRLPEPKRMCPELAGTAVNPHLFNLVGAYHEICRIHEQGPIDLVSAPLWLCEGLVAGFDNRFPTTTTLITAMKAVAGLAEWAKQSPEAQQLVALEEELVAQSRYLHAVSRPILERAIQEYGANPAHAFIANLGLQDRREQYFRRRPTTGRVRVLYVGRVETRKGADLILEAAGRLCQELPDVEFVLAGKDIPTDQGYTHRQLFEAAHAGNPDVLSRVIFAGLVSEDELYQHYADSDIVCLPSRYESFGLVFVEGMIFGKPVIGARAGGMVEVIADGEQGYLIPPGDADALTDSLRRLIVDPQLRERFGQRSRELYDQRFSVPVMVAECEKHFRAAIARHRAQPGWNPTIPTPREAVSQRLAVTLTRALGLTSEAARSVSNWLLDPQHHPIDYPCQIQKVWNAPINEFIAEMFSLLLGRQARPEEIHYWHVETRKHNLRRIEIVRIFTQSAAAKMRNLSDGWVPQLEAACGLGEFAELAVSPPPPGAPAPKPTVRHRLARMKYIGKVFKYARRAVFLPWNFHKFYHNFANGQHIVDTLAQRQATTDQVINNEVLPLLRQLLQRQEGFRQLLWKQETTLTARQEVLATMFEERITQLADSLVANPEAVEPTNVDLDAIAPLTPSKNGLRHAG